MTISYRNTFRDLLAFSRYHYSRNWVILVTLAAFVLATSGAIVRAMPSGQSLGISVFTGVVMELILLAGMIALVAVTIVLSLISPRNRTFLTDHSLAFGPEGVTEQTKYNTTVHTWAAVQKVCRTNSYLFLYIAQHAAHVIPRRAAGSQQEWDALYEYAKASAASAST